MSHDLNDILQRLRLTEYLPTLLDNGFDSWDVVCDITEDDLAQLGFKLGHRRTLQREIANWRGLTLGQPLDTIDGMSQSSRSFNPPDLPANSTTPPNGCERKKRKYRRKPRPDINAPKKPNTAYVNFAAELRADPSVNSLSFVAIAREVGRQWQALPMESRHAWESQAAKAMQEYEAQMDEYRTTENYRRYQNYLKGFRKQHEEKERKGSNTNIVPSIENGYDASRGSTDTGSVRSPDRKSASNLGPQELEDCHAALSIALQELSVRRSLTMTEEIPIFDAQHLPPEMVVRQAAHSAVLGTGTMLHLTTEDQLEDALNHVYGPGPINPVVLVFVLACAAVGAHYDVQCMSDEMRYGIYVSATLLFNSDVAHSNYPETMRILLLLAVYSLLEKHMTICHVLAAGLSVSRWVFCPSNDEQISADGLEEARRILCTLIFMDCWLSTTLGYRSDTRPIDIKNTWSPLPDCPITDSIRFQASRIGLVMREIAEQTMHSGVSSVKVERIEALTEMLDVWYRELPPIMHLAALTSEEQSSILTFYQRRAIMMVHMFYLGAVITLYRQLMLTSSQNRIQSTWHLEMSYSQTQHYRQKCSVAAQQMVRMMALISFNNNGNMTKRCWLMIYWAFHTCVVVLLSISQQLLDQDLSTVIEDLSHAKTCMDILSICADAEPVSANHLELIKPFYDSLCQHQQAIAAKIHSSNNDSNNDNNTTTTTTTTTNNSANTDNAPHDSSQSPVDGRLPNLSFPAAADGKPSDGYHHADHMTGLFPPLPQLAGYQNPNSDGVQNQQQQQQPLGWDTELVTTVRKLSDLLNEPYGWGRQAKLDGARRSGDAAGTFSVLWWD
ncbi:uncharacterized protein K452DRAFT_311513 [Aplosporella prunicola CBS 121167]|uniref:HMG box domain-containing protein n=1 Tax=Aplosporella prunicola CBS 121167 TaxID=1176127 RepID=A0A6A6B3F1_9PEZI|nr:uncharacterized protein K452DRAFT_311513 [Aplosporella prunicola CBS 121167]KAF2138580.1 hypothetical protein K452DRAFT_311513 [Aplosporella prunicola CBS 121167]